MPTGGGDQVRLLHFQNGKAGPPLDVTEPGRDVWRPAVATAGDGSVVVVWTEKRGDNWDLFSRRYDPKTSAFSPELRITDQPGTDSDAVLATAAERHGLAGLASVDRRPGRYLAGPARRQRQARAHRRSRSATRPPTSGRPRIAADSSGRVHVAFDSYQAGNYDVMLRTREADGTLSPPITVAGTACV